MHKALLHGSMIVATLLMAVVTSLVNSRQVAAATPDAVAPLVWSVVAPPLAPVQGSDGRVHLVYELLFTDVTNTTVRLDTLEVVDPLDHRVIGTLPQDQRLTFTRDDPEDFGAHQPMTLGGRNGNGVWEPKVASGYGYTVSAGPGAPPGRPVLGSGIPRVIDVGFNAGEWGGRLQRWTSPLVRCTPSSSVPLTP